MVNKKLFFMIMLVAILVFGLALIGCNPDSSDDEWYDTPMVGKWYGTPEKAKMGGVSDYEFTSDGKIIIMGTVSSVTYSVNYDVIADIDTITVNNAGVPSTTTLIMGGFSDSVSVDGGPAGYIGEWNFVEFASTVAVIEAGRYYKYRNN